jgi:hypothetical protein
MYIHYQGDAHTGYKRPDGHHYNRRHLGPSRHELHQAIRVLKSCTLTICPSTDVYCRVGGSVLNRTRAVFHGKSTCQPHITHLNLSLNLRFYNSNICSVHKIHTVPITCPLSESYPVIRKRDVVHGHPRWSQGCSATLSYADRGAVSPLLHSAATFLYQLQTS